jgi:3-oxoacyl-[acyl-carrier-protein] synthase II
MSDRRVVVTGMGAVTPLGVTVPVLWDGLIEGRSGISAVTLFDTTGFDVRIGGQCRDYDPNAHLDRKVLKRIDRFSQFALTAADEAVRMAALDFSRENPERVSVVFGSGIGGLTEIEEQHTRLLERGPGKVSAFTIPKLMLNAASANISMTYGAKGMGTAVATACASAANAIADGLWLIRRGEADVVFTGGAEAALTPLALAAFASMRALSTRNDDPPRASRPFDRDRDGFVLGEGSGAVILEDLEHARRRGAPILAELSGAGCTSDSGHITQPDEEGRGAAEAMRRALVDSGVQPDEVDYISAHGTATPLGDIAETRAIKGVFGPHAHKLTISSIKGAIGHLLGASGGVATIAAIQSIRNGTIPPTINLDHPGEGCDLDYCPRTARDRKVRTALINSFGFGGHNSCVLFSRFTG